MAHSTFSLSWEAHTTNICNGVSLLQQKEEYVDMTIAADGHFVKVHRMIMALASPYFKALISSAGSHHPVIFLNKVSYTTLNAILEYIYTGKVLISIDNLAGLLQAAKELNIKGLEDMKLQNSFPNSLQTDTQEEECEEIPIENVENSEIDDEFSYFEVPNPDDNEDTQSQKSFIMAQDDDGVLEEAKSIRSIPASESDLEEISLDGSKSIKSFSVTSEGSGQTALEPASIQYTVSNQGSIQMILNRFIYYLKHSNQNKSRQWRCVDYVSKRRCPAILVTKDNIVIQRLAAHSHAHHDKRILKKVRDNAIYAAIQDAVIEGNDIKNKVMQEKKETDSAINSLTQNETE